ncbi:hypothetical protein ACWGR4_01540 [Embleya sp. NPDC055664]
MTSDETESTVITAAGGAQQIPATLAVEGVSAVTEARDKLLQAIGTEAQVVAEKSPGQASTALEGLARAFALVTRGVEIQFADAGGAAVRTPISLDIRPPISMDVENVQFTASEQSQRPIDPPRPSLG